jgi:oligopeptide/dipeptide ABC transporter ATP-binding protein
VLAELRETRGLGLVFVTHDLGIIGQICDDIAVMYAGRVVETGPVGAVLDAPRHPYTAALLAAAIDVDSGPQAPRAIPGPVPDLLSLPPGCPFQPRCPLARPDCAAGPVPLLAVGRDRATACLHYEALAGPAGPGAEATHG